MGQKTEAKLGLQGQLDVAYTALRQVQEAQQQLQVRSATCRTAGTRHRGLQRWCLL